MGVHEWFGDRPYATWPWAEGARAALNATPEVQKGMEIDVEWVWSMEPDLIIATFAPLDPQTYAQLSQIAPVIGQPEGYPRWGAPWDVELRLIAQATAREAEAEAMIARNQAQIETLMLGGEMGAALGIHPGRALSLGFLAITLTAGATVALAGPVGFIGLIAPHLARRIAPQAGLAMTVLLACPMGASLALLADTAGRWLVRPAELPLGIVLAMIGAPAFMLLVRRMLRGTE